MILGDTLEEATRIFEFILFPRRIKTSSMSVAAVLMGRMSSHSHIRKYRAPGIATFKSCAVAVAS